MAELAQTRKKLKLGSLKFLDYSAIIRLIFWILLCGVLLTFTILFTMERTGFNDYVIPDGVYAGMKVQDIKDGISNGTINASSDPSLIQAYIALYKASMAEGNFTFINFSLMTFVNSAFSQPATDPTTSWTTRSNSIDLAYSYMFITLLIGLVALALQIYTNGKMIMENHRIKKLQLGTKFPSSTINFSLFRTKMYVDFVVNLTLVFTFFNFLSTLIVIGYWLLIYLISWIVKKCRKTTSFEDTSFSQNKSDLVYLIFVMCFQTIYTIVKAIFISEWGVNLDLIFSIILPIGTITVIVGIFIKNMLTSKVNNVLKDIKNIKGTINTLQTFYFTNGMDSFNDFNFIAILPPMIKTPLSTGKITKQQANDLLIELNKMIDFVNEHYAALFTKRSKKPNELNFMLYNVINNIHSKEQIDELKDNILKLEAFVTKK